MAVLARTACRRIAAFFAWLLSASNLAMAVGVQDCVAMTNVRVGSGAAGSITPEIHRLQPLDGSA